VYGENGEEISVLKNASAPPIPVEPIQVEQGPINEMLTAIEQWVAQAPIRKWKLVLDEQGWHACVWFNQYKKICFDTSDRNLSVCIQRSYSKIRQELN